MTLCEGEHIEAADLQLRDSDSTVSTTLTEQDAAKLLGITFRALRYRLKKLGLE